jgi:ABC-type multidrug transport system fused ATPase/permease subunit
MLVSKLLSKSLLFVQSRTSQEILYSVTTGVNIITLGVLGTGVSLISDVSLLLVMGVGLFVVDPIIAVSTAIFFGLIGYALYSLMHKKAAALGLEQAEKGIASNEKIIEVLHSYRESVVRNRRSFYAQEIGNLRLQLSNNMAETTFLPYVSKYVIESTVVLGALIISAVQFMLQDASHAVATLAVFLAAGTRIAPAVMRVQQGAILIRSSLGSAAPTLELIEELHDTLEIDAVDQHLVLVHHGFEPKVVIKNVSFAYPGNHKSALTEINLKINSGQVVAFVGTSGAGKTTLVDILLGVLQPEQGLIEISGVAPLIAVAKWPGAISYIPQDVTISNGTIRENVALGYPIEDATDELVWNALKLAQLSEFVETLPAGLETKVGERGTRISGGQRQRLGIARGLFTKPKLLVLDEATSAVDGQTEAEISDAVHALKGEVTVVLIAHRLSTVRHADQVIYLEEGKIIAKGTFDEIRIKVPNFDHQAKLMGL